MNGPAHIDTDVELIKSDQRWLNVSILEFARNLYQTDCDMACSVLHASVDVLNYIAQWDSAAIERVASVGVPLFALRKGRDLPYWQSMLEPGNDSHEQPSDLRWLNTGLLMFARGAALRNPWLAASTLNSSNEVLSFIADLGVGETLRYASIGLCHFRLRHGFDIGIWKDAHGAALSEYADERLSRNFRVNVLTMVGDDDND